MCPDWESRHDLVRHRSTLNTEPHTPGCNCQFFFFFLHVTIWVLPGQMRYGVGCRMSPEEGRGSIEQRGMLSLEEGRECLRTPQPSALRIKQCQPKLGWNGLTSPGPHHQNIMTLNRHFPELESRSEGTTSWAPGHSLGRGASSPFLQGSCKPHLIYTLSV